MNSSVTPYQGGAIDGHLDACGYRRWCGLLAPASKTTMENELSNILVQNRKSGFTTSVLHPGRLLPKF